MRIYLDSCCFNRPFDDQTQLRIKLETEAKTRIQEYILSDEIKLVWSYMMEYENNMNPYGERRDSIEKWQEQCEVNIEEQTEIIQLANRFVNIGLHTKDSIHISCAIYANCDYFLTTDDKILNKSNLIEEIKISDPIEFIRRFEE